MDAQRSKLSRGVALPPQHTGSSLFHAVLAEAVAAYPEVLKPADLPEQASAWKRNYGQVLARFEACRAASPKRVEIARFILERSQATLVHMNNGASVPLAEHLAAPVAAPALQPVPLGGAPTMRAEVPLDGRLYRGLDVLELVDRLAESGDLTVAAQRALRWSVEHIEQQGGVLDLRGQTFVMLGAGAELAPTEWLLRAGASVLWVDITNPTSWLTKHEVHSGTVLHPSEPFNLLDNPAAIRACIDQLAQERGPLNVGLFAYASGASQEWRLGAAMNAIVSGVDPRAIRSLSMLVSPTTVPTLQPESVRAAERQLTREPVWKNALGRAGLLPKPGHVGSNGVRIGLSTVSIQGLSYQAAQYVSKLCAAETFAVYGNGRDGATPLTVSANVAGITRTRSMSHPLFAAAFIGAPRFGVRIFDTGTTRALSGLLILHDLLNPAAPGSAEQQAEPAIKAAALHSQQVHGGIYNLPYVLEPAIRIAALIGMGRRPSLLLGRPSRASAEARA